MNMNGYEDCLWLTWHKYNFPSERLRLYDNRCFFSDFLQNWHTIQSIMTTTLHVKIALQKIYVFCMIFSYVRNSHLVEGEAYTD